MFELIILSCRYLFIFYILYFILQSAKVLLDERQIKNTNVELCFSKQRISIVFFHLTALLILAYNPEILRFDKTILFWGFLALALIVFGNLTLSKIYKKSFSMIWNCIFLLMDIGIITLIRLNFYLAQRQLIWFAIGILITAALPFIFNIIPRLDKLKYVYIGISIALLVATSIFGAIKGGAKNWITFGNISFQPSEIMKILFILYLASEFSVIKNFKQLIVPAILSSILVIGLVTQTDLGGALIFFMTFMVMIYIATQSDLLFLSGLVFASFASVLGYKLFSHVRVRVEIWRDPWIDIEGKGWQIAQSLFAIGTPSIFGSGLTRGLPTSIPVVESDSIFAAICEEFGVIMGLLMLAMLLIVFYYCAKIALSTYNRFLALLAAGSTSLLCFQTFLIIGGITKLIPLTGVTLPFVSYGGTSVVISFIIIGVLQWIATLNAKQSMQESEEK